MPAKVITANRLRDGRVVWRAGDGWCLSITGADLWREAEVEPALAAARQDECRRIVVDVYAIDVDSGAGAPVPARMRERIRAAGPSVRPDLVRPDLVPSSQPRKSPASVEA